MSAVQKLILIYGLIINAGGMFLFGFDKYHAVKNRWRIPENALLGCAFAGGCFGCLLAMHVFRHKTRKPLFRIMIPVLCVLWTVVGVYAYFHL